MKLIRMVFALSFATLVLPGCMQVDYVGQHFTPSEKVTFLGGGESADGYDMIGRATLTAPDGYNSEEIRQKLLKEAQEVGADAVIIDSAKRVETGSYANVDNPNGSFDTTGQLGKNNINTDGSRNYTNSWGQTGPDRVTETKQYEVVVKSYFLRHKDKNVKPAAPTPVTAPLPVTAKPATPIKAKEVKPAAEPEKAR